MQLPIPLRQAIEEELSGFNPAQLRAASSRLSQCYREGGNGAPSGTPGSGSAAGAPLSDDLQRAAYLGVRMPATYAAVVAALEWTREAIPNVPLRTMLDLGSGPGTALWAAAQVFPTLHSATAVERDPKLIETARRLSARSEAALLRHTTWLRGDLNLGLAHDPLPNDLHSNPRLPEESWDIVVLSYVLNELAEPRCAELIRQAWARTAQLLVVVEPGTRAGFANVLAVRTALLAATTSPATSGSASMQGSAATLAAPCPCAQACPMAVSGDWCHFAARIERTADHRRLKDATLGHEDEKFSYVAFSRAPTSPAPARIVRHPRIFSGYAQISLCREGKIEATTVTRSQKEDWRRLKRLGWGDSW